MSINSSKESNGDFKGVVYQYDKKCNLIKTWKALYEIEGVYGKKYCNICSCINGKIKSAYGYVWTRNKMSQV